MQHAALIALYSLQPCFPEEHLPRPMCVQACDNYYKCNVTTPSAWNSSALAGSPVAFPDGEVNPARPRRRAVSATDRPPNLPWS